MLQLQEKGDIPSDVTLDFEDDMRVDQLAEYLYEVEKHVGVVTSREAVSAEIVKVLDMQEYQTGFEAIPRDNKAGGVPLHWYFLAGKYLMKNRGFDANQMEDLLANIANRVVVIFEEDIECHEAEKEGFGVLREYIQQTVDINGHGEIKQQSLRSELVIGNYATRKRKDTDSATPVTANAGEIIYAEDLKQSLTQAGIYVTSGTFDRETKSHSHKNLIQFFTIQIRIGICELCEVEMPCCSQIGNVFSIYD